MHKRHEAILRIYKENKENNKKIIIIYFRFETELKARQPLL